MNSVLKEALSLSVADRLQLRELLEAIERTRPVARKGAPTAAELIREDRDRR